MSRDIHPGTHPHPHLARKTDHATRQAIIDGYAAGRNMTDLGREHGIHAYTVRKILLDAGVELRFNAARGKPFGGGS